MTLQNKQLYSITIFGYKKEGMSESDYHDHVSKVHAGHLKALLASNDIVCYSMQHNTTDSKSMLDTIHPGIPENKVSDCDTVVQIVFKDLQDYLRVRDDPHWHNVVNPDHANFADPHKTKFVTGWFEFHVLDGKICSK